MDELRTHHGGNLGSRDVGDRVRIAGWVATRRDHGGVIFIDIRDASGIVQAVINPDDAPDLGVAAHELRSEFCVSVAGTVRQRPDGTVNPDLPSGEIEIAVDHLKVLSPAEPLPFRIDQRSGVDELRRLEYRYLDLRRPEMAANLRARAAAVRAMRYTLDEAGFLDVETPTLIKTTPEGARDFVVPSRLRRGKVYALPQSPQLFKQLLMIAGVERYYQIARCYRDEDFRADRQVEFTQLDVEGAFWGRDEVFDAIEAAVCASVEAVRGTAPERPFPRLTWADAMARYGSDKPDVRFGMEITDVGDVFAGTGFKAFAGVLAGGGSIRAVNAGILGLSRTGLDGLVKAAQQYGAKGLVWLVVEDDGTLRSPAAKFLSGDELASLVNRLDAGPGDVLLVVADEERVAGGVLGRLRLDLGRPEGHDALAFLWVTDFPVFETTADGKLAPAHHPFTAPVDVTDLVENPAGAVSQAYDLVLNGSELGSGSVRIHDPAVQSEVFDVLGIDPAEAESRFGWFLQALRFGTPPHAGFAVGIDRLVSILRREDNIREVMPFPKTQTGLDPMTGAPSRMDEAQLAELGLRLTDEALAELEDPGD